MDNPHQPYIVNGSILGASSSYIRQSVLPFRPESQTSHPGNVYPPSPGLRTLRHSLLQGEGVCTENLTPWEKLLPCRSQVRIKN